jgi:hypothetical protein
MSTDIQVPSSVVNPISRVRPRGWVTSHPLEEGWAEVDWFSERPNRVPRAAGLRNEGIGMTRRVEMLSLF